MKKHLAKLLLSLLFLVATSMSCGETAEITEDIPCLLKEVELCHWDNAAELPCEPVENKVLKAAYILEIRLLTEVEEDDVESYYNGSLTQHVLTDYIARIQIFTQTAFNEKYPKGADVTSCFSNYPKYFINYQLRDYTTIGGFISVVDKTNRIFKALMVAPPPGEYRFRVLLTMKSGKTLERMSEPILLY